MGPRTSRAKGSRLDCVILRHNSNPMEKLYHQSNKTTEQHKASEETVRFLLDYSRSLSVVKSRGLTFERNLN